MNTIDKVITMLMGVCIICAVSTIVLYLLYELFNIGEAYFSMVFFMCSIFGAGIFALIGVILLSADRKSKDLDGVKK